MRIKLTLSYDGTNYCGWQRQKNGVSVQETVESAIYSLTAERVKVIGSGRTDAGVHAEGQVAHFDTQSSIPPEKFYKALNTYLPYDVKATASESVENDFDASRGAKKKIYRYSLYLSDTELPLKERYAVREGGKIDIAKMISAAKIIEGEHDFKCFSSTGGSAKTSIRTVYSLTVTEEKDELKITVCGNGFLYNMVRIIAGTLLKVAKGEISEDNIKRAFTTGERKLLGETLPAKGLCLEKVEYFA